MERSDCLSSIREASFDFYLPYRSSASSFSLPGAQDAVAPRGLEDGSPAPHKPDIRSEMTGPPRFLGRPSCQRAPLSDPGGPARASPHTARPMLPSGSLTPSAPQVEVFRGSITQPTDSLSTLRSPGYPGTTQDSLPARWLGFGRAGLAPAGLQFCVSGDHQLPPSPQTRLCLAQ